MDLDLCSGRRCRTTSQCGQRGRFRDAVPDISIEVDNLDEIYERVRAGGFSVEYGPVNEPWGVRRFYVRDPFGRLLNILTHG
jgi:catechol 2,3-dioxygenase-like lactoylglutathione lyase family enzyme